MIAWLVPAVGNLLNGADLLFVAEVGQSYCALLVRSALAKLHERGIKHNTVEPGT